MRGLELSEKFYHDVAKPILQTHFPDLQYAAALLGWSSEVLGYDDEESTDHNWGPRFQLFLQLSDFDLLKTKIGQVLSKNLPLEFCGFSTNFGVSSRGDQSVIDEIASGAVNHKIDIETVETWFESNFGNDLDKDFSVADWLVLSEQKLLALTNGKVFDDNFGKLTAARQKLNYYPREVWLYLLACQWKKIAEEEAFVGRAGFVGDELGSAIVATRIVKSLLRICFLMERKYAPYSKWFGTAFSRLDCGKELTPIFREVLRAEKWQKREANLSKAYEIIARMHNDLKITAPLPDKVTKHGRPYLVIHGERFFLAILETIKESEIGKIGFTGGSVNQFAEMDNELENAGTCQKLRVLYE